MAKLNELENKGLLSLYSDLLEEMIKRKLIRTKNNPVGDYGEYIVANKLKLKLVKNSKKGYDAVDSKKNRYQIKARRHSARKRSMQLGVIRNIEDRPFDFLVAVFLNSDFSIKAMWKFPISIIKKYSRHSEHQNGRILTLRSEILNDSRTVKLM